MLSASVDEIAATILAHTPDLTRDGQGVSLATYRLLAEGAPVEVTQIAERIAGEAHRVDGPGA